MTSSKFKITSASAKELFANRTFIVPLFQREYKWENEDCDNFWEDVMKEGEHYTAGIVLRRSNVGYYDIIDGQQRITTVSLLAIAAMRILKFDFPGEDEPTRARCMNEVAHAFLVNGPEEWSSYQGRDAFLRKSKLRVRDDHRDFYHGLLALKPPSSTTNPHYFHPKPKKKDKAQYQMKKAVDIFLERMKEQKFKCPSDVKDFIIDKMGKEIIFSLIETETEENAHAIFETLNGKGKALKPIDLIKNYFLSAMPSEKEEKRLSVTWQGIFDSPPFKKEHRQVNFIRSVHNYWYGFAGQKRLYTEIVKSIKVVENDGLCHTSVWQFMDVLEKQKKLYQQLLEPSDSYWQAKNYERVKILADLGVLGVNRFYPLILVADKTSAVGSEFSDAEFSEILRICVAIIIRRELCSRPSRVLEHAFHKVAHEVYSQNITSPHQIFAYLDKAEGRRLYPRDAEIKTQLKAEKKLIKYVLKKIEEHLSGEAEIQENYHLCRVGKGDNLEDYVLYENRTPPSQLEDLNNSSFKNATITQWKNGWDLDDSENRRKQLAEIVVKIEEWKMDNPNYINLF